MRTIQERWNDFAENVIPKDAPAIQVQEMRRAFYAGAGASLDVMYDTADESISDEAGAKIMQGLFEEMNDFASKVGTDQEGCCGACDGCENLPSSLKHQAD